ncbi:MAG: hypothetical protein IKY73_07245 [Bacteroidaceae bacterium]|nr:hypothetical protein [Bacteroidaceae bacterium]
MNFIKTNFLTGIVLILLLASCDANHTQKFNSIKKNDIAGYENFISKYPSSIHVETARKYINEELCRQNEPLWEHWFSNRRDDYIYFFDQLSREHDKAINDLLSLFYDAPDSLRNNHHLIQWRLNKFYPLQTTKEDKYTEFLNLKQQVDSLLCFDVETDGYQIRRKSALARLMNEFLLNMYENKLVESITEPSLLALFEQECKSWYSYCESTSNTFEKIVLGKFQYKLKATFWNNYDFDIMNQRLKSLVFLYCKDTSIWSDDVCGWNDVENGFNNIRENIKPDNNLEYDFTYDEKVKALDDDKKTFKDFINVHRRLMTKFNIASDESHLLYFKTRTLNRFMDYYNHDIINKYD